MIGDQTGDKLNRDEWQGKGHILMYQAKGWHDPLPAVSNSGFYFAHAACLLVPIVTQTSALLLFDAEKEAPNLISDHSLTLAHRI